MPDWAALSPPPVSVIEEVDSGPMVFIASEGYHERDVPPFAECAGLSHPVRAVK
jgi:hypothetical protein